MGGFGSLIRLLRTKAENMNERIHKYFYEELSTEERLSLLRDVEESEELATKILSSSEVKAIIDIHNGEYKATAWGCDLTYDYVKINADYRS